MDYKLMNDNNMSYQQQQQQQQQNNMIEIPSAQLNYNYPSNEISINNHHGSASHTNSFIVEGQPIEGAVIIDITQVNQQNQPPIMMMENPQMHYMERPFMPNPMFDESSNNLSNQQLNGPPQAPPPPPQLQNPIATDSSIQQPFKNEFYEVRNICDIEECRHQNPQKYLYISSPKILISSLIIAFYIIGVISLIVGVIILIIVAVVALSNDKNGGDCKCNDCNICNSCNGNCNCSCAFFNFCDCCLRSTEICCLNTRSGVVYSQTYGYDYNYYRYRYHRKRYYHEYQDQQNLNNCCDALGRCFYEICCCSCCDNVQLGNATDSCMVNKVEVYCTECNSKLKEEWTGTKHIAPSLLLGMFGIIILVVSILLLKHYNVA